MVSKKYNDHLDSTSFVMGLVTLLKQYHSEVTDQFFSLLGQYVRSNADSNITKLVSLASISIESFPAPMNPFILKNCFIGLFNLHF